MKPIIVNARQLADLFGVTSRTIGHFSDRGMPKIARSKYNYTACWLWRFEQQKIDYEKKLEGLDWKEQEARYKAAKASREEILLAQMRGELIDVEQVAAVNTRIVDAVRNRLLALPVKTALRIMACRDVKEVKAILEQSIEELLGELSGLSTSATATRGIRDTDVPKVPASAKVDRKPVGRRKARVKSRGRKRTRKLANGQG